MKPDIFFSNEDEDLRGHRWRIDKYGYLRRIVRWRDRESGRRVIASILAHHDVCLRAFGRKPDFAKGEVCDHIDLNRLNNRRENIRIVSIAENARNRGARGGITWHRCGRWQVTFRNKYVGLFRSRTDASLRLDGLVELEKRSWPIKLEKGDFV